MNPEIQYSIWEVLLRQNPEIVRSRDWAKSCFYGAELLVGLVLCVVARMQLFANNLVSALVLLFGICVIGVAVLFLIHGSSRWIYRPTKSRIVGGQTPLSLVQLMDVAWLFPSAEIEELRYQAPSDDFLFEYVYSQDGIFLAVGVRPKADSVACEVEIVQCFQGSEATEALSRMPRDILSWSR